jgi:tetratricopeptide (TPR) repeat protein
MVRTAEQSDKKKKRLRWLALLLLFLFVGCVSRNKTSEGVRYYGQAQYDSALLAFQEANKANPNNSDTEYNIAATYHQAARVALQSGQLAAAQQNYDQAVQYYQLCLNKSPNYTDAYRGLATLYLDCKNPDAAFQILLNWVNANPVAPEPKIELARLYQEFGQICQMQGRGEVAKDCQASARKMLETVLLTDSSNYRALRALGFLKEQTGDIAGAVSDYQRSLQANPSQKDLQNRITQLTAGK